MMTNLSHHLQSLNRKHLEFLSRPHREPHKEDRLPHKAGMLGPDWSRVVRVGTHAIHEAEDCALEIGWPSEVYPIISCFCPEAVFT